MSSILWEKITSVIGGDFVAISGRAIRHKGDYATILLLDQRYARPSVQGKLPGWIRQRLQITPRFGPAFATISKVSVAHLTEKVYQLSSLGSI